MEKFKINSVRAELNAWLHPIQNHLVIQVQDECSMSVDRGNGDEEEYEFGADIYIFNFLHLFN